MTRVSRGRLAFLAAFAVLLVDGAAAVWLGQLAGSGLMLWAGLGLLASALALALAFPRWQRALDEVDAARRAVRGEADALRRAVRDARAGGPGR